MAEITEFRSARAEHNHAYKTLPKHWKKLVDKHVIAGTALEDVLPAISRLHARVPHGTEERVLEANRMYGEAEARKLMLVLSNHFDKLTPGLQRTIENNSVKSMGLSAEVLKHLGKSMDSLPKEFKSIIERVGSKDIPKITNLTEALSKNVPIEFASSITKLSQKDLAQSAIVAKAIGDHLDTITTYPGLAESLQKTIVTRPLSSVKVLEILSSHGDLLRKNDVKEVLEALEEHPQKTAKTLSTLIDKHDREAFNSFKNTIKTRMSKAKAQELNEAKREYVSTEDAPIAEALSKIFKDHDSVYEYFQNKTFYKDFKKKAKKLGLKNEFDKPGQEISFRSVIRPAERIADAIGKTDALKDTHLTFGRLDELLYSDAALKNMSDGIIDSLVNGLSIEGSSINMMPKQPNTRKEKINALKKYRLPDRIEEMGAESIQEEIQDMISNSLKDFDERIQEVKDKKEEEKMVNEYVGLSNFLMNQRDGAFINAFEQAQENEDLSETLPTLKTRYMKDLPHVFEDLGASKIVLKGLEKHQKQIKRAINKVEEINENRTSIVRNFDLTLRDRGADDLMSGDEVDDSTSLSDGKEFFETAAKQIMDPAMLNFKLTNHKNGELLANVRAMVADMNDNPVIVLDSISKTQGTPNKSLLNGVIGTLTEYAKKNGFSGVYTSGHVSPNFDLKAHVQENTVKTASTLEKIGGLSHLSENKLALTEGIKTFEKIGGTKGNVDLFRIATLKKNLDFEGIKLTESGLEVSDKYVKKRMMDLNVGGLEKEVKKVIELIELPMLHPEIFTDMGIAAPKGVLMHGPPGTGKTLLAREIASKIGANFIPINGPELYSSLVGKGEAQLREKFEEAEKSDKPTIIFIDEIDALAPKRGEDNASGGGEARMVGQLLALMDGFKPTSKVIVLAATNRPDVVDPALRRPGRFDREIRFGMPSEKGRKDILQIQLKPLTTRTDVRKIHADIDLNPIANQTQGYSGADLAALVKEASMHAIHRTFPELIGEAEEGDPLPQSALNKIVLNQEDLWYGLNNTEASSLRELAYEIPNVHWEDVGGLDEAKQQMQDLVQLPFQKKELFEEIGIEPAKGVLLYGPPGTGKTLLAKAVATEANVNFISVKGPELLNKWVGESEKGVREIFKKAREAAPCVVFLDEVESILRKRSDSGHGITDNMVSQFLTEIDGAKKLKDVVVIAATNRPDLLDPAVMRPGRLDHKVLIPLPNNEGIRKVLETHLSKIKASEDVDPYKLARKLNGYSGADIMHFVREAGMNAIRRESKVVEPIDFTKALTNVKPSVDKATAESYDKWASKQKEEKINADSGAGHMFG